MNPLLATAIITLVIAVGNFVAQKTKAMLSMMFVAAMLFLLMFWCGMPETMFNDSTLINVAGIAIAMCLVHMGTTISMKQFIENWKTVVISTVACAGVCFGVYLLGGLLIDKAQAMISASVLSGGVVANIIMGKIAETAGRQDLVLIGALVLVIQQIFAIPVASFFLRGEAKKLVSEIDNNEVNIAEYIKNEETSSKGRKTLIPQIPEKYNKPFVILFKVAIVAFFGAMVTSWINQTWLSAMVLYLLFGILFKELGFLDENALQKANALNFVMLVVLVVIFKGLAGATPQDVFGLLGPIMVFIIIGMVSFGLVGGLVAKLLGVDWRLGVAFGSTAYYGFPGTMVVATEVANAMGRNEEEVNYLTKKLLPGMLIAGICTVSVFSVVFAGIMAPMFQALIG